VKTVFVDTSGLLPLLDRSNPEREKLIETVAELAEQRARLVTTNYVFVETAALVRNRLGVAPLRALGGVLERDFDLIWIDEGLHRMAWELVVREGRKGPSLVDWVSFLAMRDRKIGTALALDRHFRTQGFATLP